MDKKTNKSSHQRYAENVKLVCILDKKETVLRNWVVAWVKVQWKHFIPEEATWELEEEL